MFDDAIDLLTRQMIKDDFDDKKNNVKSTITITRTELYQFCIKLIKLVKNVSEMEVE